MRFLLTTLNCFSSASLSLADRKAPKSAASSLSSASVVSMGVSGLSERGKRRVGCGSMMAGLPRLTMVISVTITALSWIAILGECQLHFASLGSWGFPDAEGSQSTGMAVAQTLKAVAPSQHLSFIVSPGSNYAGGVKDLNDTKWQDYFEKPYEGAGAPLRVPFFTVLGTEDWQGNYTAEIDRTKETFNETSTLASGTFPKWTLPNWWYYYVTVFPDNEGPSFIRTGHKDVQAAFVFIDTWILSDQFPIRNAFHEAWKYLDSTLSKLASVAEWIIVVGDKPIYSSGGSKGDSYLQSYLLPMLRKYTVDAYISGYDFNMEVIKSPSKTKDKPVPALSFLTCGSGSVGSPEALSKHSNSVFFSGAPGFCLHTITSSSLKTDFYDGKTGEVLYSHEQPKVPKPSSHMPASFKYENFTNLPEVEFFPVPPISHPPLASQNVFVDVIGTLGLTVGSILAGATALVGISRVMKRS